jgi:hypothetical protein
MQPNGADAGFLQTVCHHFQRVAARGFQRMRRRIDRDTRIGGNGIACELMSFEAGDAVLAIA